MKRHRWGLLAFLLALVLAVVAAGCGGDDEEGEGGGGATTAAEGGGNVSGSVNVLAVWTGAEGEAFQAVLDGFKEQNPNVTVKYKSAQDIATVLSTAIEGGNPPDVAALPNPGLMKDFAQRGALKPIPFAEDVIRENYSEDWLNLGMVDGELYGLFFKGANKSTVWYNVEAFENAGVEPPEDWDALLESADTLNASGVPAYSIAGADGWTLTDMFENIYLRVAGPEKYDQLTNHEIPWTDQSVIDTLTRMAEVVGDADNVAGGTQGALQIDFPTSVTQVFADPPKAAMVFEGDFVGGVISAETGAEPETGYNVFPFPAIDGQGGNYVVGGGDVMVMFKDSPAAQALFKYLGSPEAAEIWAERGGFSSPNKNVNPDVYPDELTRTTASALAEAEVFRFDMSDLMPSAFGSDAMFKRLQDFLANPQDVQGAAEKLEADAKKAFK